MAYQRYASLSVLVPLNRLVLANRSASSATPGIALLASSADALPGASLSALVLGLVSRTSGVAGVLPVRALVLLLLAGLAAAVAVALVLVDGVRLGAGL
jgi:hypothetical protein